MFFSPKTTVKIPLQLYTVTYSGHKNKTAFMTVLQATDRGLEPLLTESESAVLPLHQSASFLFLSDSTFTLYRNFSKSQALFLFFKQSSNRFNPTFLRIYDRQMEVPMFQPHMVYHQTTIFHMEAFSTAGT